MHRRTFLGLTGAAAAALVLDPERLLWVPGAKTFFLPSTEILAVETMAEALTHGFLAVFPDGVRLEVHIGREGDGLTVDQRLAREVAAVRAMGGRVVQNRQWQRVPFA